MNSQSKEVKKYEYGDTVKFKLGNEILEGTVYIVDANGTWELPGVRSYDILACSPRYVSEMNPKGECLFKHISENLLC